jgi:hypothetical protein
MKVKRKKYQVTSKEDPSAKTIEEKLTKFLAAENIQPNPLLMKIIPKRVFIILQGIKSKQYAMILRIYFRRV